MSRSPIILQLAAIASLTLLGAAPPHQMPACIHGDFEGITHTLSDGTVVGSPDARDWGCAERGHGAGTGAPGHAPVARARIANTDPGASVSGVPAPPPTVLCMGPAAPNPTAGAMRIQFALPVAGHVTVSVYERRPGHGPGEASVVRTLIDADLAVGTFEISWDLSDDNGARLAPGIYRVVLVAGDEALCGDVEIE